MHVKALLGAGGSARSAHRSFEAHSKLFAQTLINQERRHNHPFHRARRNRPQTAHCATPLPRANAATLEKQDLRSDQEEKALVSCLVIVPSNAASPLGKHEEVSWLEVMQHVAKRLSNVNSSFKMEVLTDTELKANSFLVNEWAS